MLGFAVCLTTAVQAEKVGFVARVGFNEGVQLLLRDKGTMELDLKTLRSDIVLGAAQIGLSIAPAFDAKV